MNQPPLIIPFQTEIYVTNNKNTPDKNCVRISPNYENVEYVSYLGGRMEPPPFSFQQPWQAGIHLHFLLAVFCLVRYTGFFGRDILPIIPTESPKGKFIAELATPRRR